MKHIITQKNYVFQIRMYGLFAAAFAVTLFLMFEFDNKISYLIGVLSLLFTVFTYIDPLINPVVNVVFKETQVVERFEIYQSVIANILTANNIVRL